MNTLMLVALAVVALCYCGGKYCPKVLSSNKELVLGVLVGMALCSFAGLRLEGYENANDCLEACPTMSGECSFFYRDAVDCEGVRRASRGAELREWELAEKTRGRTAAEAAAAAAALPPLPTLPPLRDGK